MLVGTFQHLPNNTRRWIGREWIDDARQLQREGLTLREIAARLDVSREAVIKALYADEAGRT